MTDSQKEESAHLLMIVANKDNTSDSRASDTLRA